MIWQPHHRRTPSSQRHRRHHWQKRRHPLCPATLGTPVTGPGWWPIRVAAWELHYPTHQRRHLHPRFLAAIFRRMGLGGRALELGNTGRGRVAGSPSVNPDTFPSSVNRSRWAYARRCPQTGLTGGGRLGGGVGGKLKTAAPAAILLCGAINKEHALLGEGRVR